MNNPTETTTTLVDTDLKTGAFHVEVAFPSELDKALELSDRFNFERQASDIGSGALAMFPTVVLAPPEDEGEFANLTFVWDRVPGQTARDAVNLALAVLEQIAPGLVDETHSLVLLAKPA